VVEIEYLDTGLGRVENAVVLETAGHLALQATGALVRIDMQGLLHQCLLGCCSEPALSPARDLVE
jgi:hypothetical protein